MPAPVSFKKSLRLRVRVECFLTVREGTMPKPRLQAGAPRETGHPVVGGGLLNYSL